MSCQTFRRLVAISTVCLIGLLTVSTNGSKVASVSVVSEKILVSGMVAQHGQLSYPLKINVFGEMATIKLTNGQIGIRGLIELHTHGILDMLHPACNLSDSCMPVVPTPAPPPHEQEPQIWPPVFFPEPEPEQLNVPAIQPYDSMVGKESSKQKFVKKVCV